MEKKTEKEEKYMKELQDRYIRFDWAIKRLLRQKAKVIIYYFTLSLK